MRKADNTTNTRGIGNGSTTTRNVVPNYREVVNAGYSARRAARREFVPAHLRDRAPKRLGAYA